MSTQVQVFLASGGRAGGEVPGVPCPPQAARKPTIKGSQRNALREVTFGVALGTAFGLECLHPPCPSVKRAKLL